MTHHHYSRAVGRWALAATLHYTGLLRLYRFFKRRVLGRDGVILCYHLVLPRANGHCDYSQRGIVTSVAHFDRQLAYLRRSFHVTSLTEYLKRRGAPSRPVAAVTFEDGWADNYEHAYPILRRHGVPATIFLTTGFVDSGRPFWHTTLIYLLTQGDLGALRVEDLPSERYPGLIAGCLLRLRDLRRRLTVDDVDELIERLKSVREELIEDLIRDLAARLRLPLEPVLSRRFALSWDRVHEMARDGIDYGAHGVTHRILTTLSAAEVVEESRGASRAIEGRLGSSVALFLCPNGESTPAIDRIVLATGYREVLPGAGGGGEGRLARLRRVNMHDGRCTGPLGRFSPALFAFALSGLREAVLHRP